MSFKQLQQAFAKYPDMQLTKSVRPVVDPRFDVAGMGAGQFYDGAGLRIAHLLGAVAGTPYDPCAVGEDDSFYEPDVNYQMLADCGFDFFIPRGGGPSTWTQGAFNPLPDKCWFKKYQDARKTGKPVGSYWVHNPFEMIDNPLSTTFAQYQIEQMKQSWYGSFIPDFLVLDVEINTMYQANGNQIHMPAPNFASTVMLTLEAMWKEFKKPIWLYSTVSFMKENGDKGGNYLLTKMDNANSGAENRFDIHYAFWPTSAYKADTLAGADDIKPLLPPIAGTITQYLTYGSTKNKGRMWQASPKLLHKACPTGALDWDLMTDLTPEQFNGYIGFTGGTTPPPDQPPDEPPANADLAQLQQQVGAMQADVDALKQWRERVKAA